MEQRASTPSDNVINLYNDASLDRSPKKNWVEKVGGLPPNVRARARAIKRKNPSWSLSHCIAVAINAVKYSRATGDSKLPGRQNQRGWIVARHTRAANSWDAKKARSGGKKVKMSNDQVETIDLRNFNAKQRRDAAKKGKAVKDDKASGGGSYPIKNAEDAKNAEKLFKAKKGKYDPKKKRKIAAHIKRQAKKTGANVNMANAKDKDQSGKKIGTKSAGVNSDSALAKAKAAYQKKKKSMSPEQRKKCEARLKSSQQRLGKKVGLAADESATVELALTKRPSSLGHTGKTASQPRAFGGKFGTKAGTGPKGSTNTTSGTESTTKVEPVTPAQISAAVSKLSIGQTVTLPGGNGKVKRLSNGFQVVKMDGSFNKVFVGQSQAVMAANRLIGGRRAKGTELSPKEKAETRKAGA